MQTVGASSQLSLTLSGNIQSTHMQTRASQFSSTLIDFELVQILMRVDKSFRYRAVISSQLSWKLALVNSHANSHSRFTRATVAPAGT
jgi:hypothetical protein